MSIAISFRTAEDLVLEKQGDHAAVEFGLIPSRWDDYGFRTSFDLLWISEDGVVPIGTVKIGQLGSYASFGGTMLRTTFEAERFLEVPPDFVSVGQDADYYANLVRYFGAKLTETILSVLHDLSLRDDLGTLASSERVVYKSLLRTVKTTTIEDQYRRIIAGGHEKDEFSLTYFVNPDSDAPRESATFLVDPSRIMPGTLQVIIGANGAGKTRMLQNIRSSLLHHDASAAGHVKVSDGKRLSGLISVSFSAFDINDASTNYISAMNDSTAASTHEGLRERRLNLALLRSGDTDDRESADAHQKAFRDLVEACASAGRADRVDRAVETLIKGDEILSEYDLGSIDALKRADFGRMSSGHKIVLLTMLGLIAHCDDRTLILIDEPEAHLHPPLLGSFITAIRDLVAATNSLAIAVTHSPVVLQQVPARHARRLWRSGSVTQFHEMSSETWGENLGRLTRAVFKVELQKSGHFALLSEAATHSSYEAALASLDGEIGSEATLILQSLIDEKERE